MYTRGVRELRSELAAVLRRAEQGESTIVSDRGRPIARIGPVDDAAPDLERLVASGAIHQPRRIGEWRERQPVRVWSGARIDRALRELRG